MSERLWLAGDIDLKGGHQHLDGNGVHVGKAVSQEKWCRK